MSEGISKIISKYKMYMSFDKNEYEMIQKIELNKLLDYIQQKENVIKEVREYIDNNTQFDYQGGDYDNHLAEWYEIINMNENNFIRGLYDILYKENKQ